MLRVRKVLRLPHLQPESGEGVEVSGWVEGVIWGVSEGKRHIITDFGVSRYGFEFLVLLVDLGWASYSLNPFHFLSWNSLSLTGLLWGLGLKGDVLWSSVWKDEVRLEWKRLTAPAPMPGTQELTQRNQTKRNRGSPRTIWVRRSSISNHLQRERIQHSRSTDRYCDDVSPASSQVWKGVLGDWEMFPKAYLDFEVRIDIIAHSA